MNRYPYPLSKLDILDINQVELDIPKRRYKKPPHTAGIAACGGTIILLESREITQLRPGLQSP